MFNFDKTPQALYSCVFIFFAWSFQLRLILRRTPKYFKLSLGGNVMVAMVIYNNFY